MVEGLPMKRRLMAVDLDGTLITGNSLHEYIRCGMRHSGLIGKLRLLGVLALRKLGLCSHLTMKRRALALINPSERLRADFVGRVDDMTRSSVLRAIEDHMAAGGEVLLATAAPETYVPWIWQGSYVSTDSASAQECRGEEKLRRVVAYAHENNLELCAAITDHPDDMPLLSHPGITRILAGDRHAERFRQLGMDFDIILP